MKKLHFNIQNLRKNTWTPAAAINTTVKDPILSGSQTKKPIFKEITEKKDDSWGKHPLPYIKPYTPARPAPSAVGIQKQPGFSF